MAGRDFDGVTEFASRLPVSVVADLVGVRVPSDQLLRWGRRVFDALGPINGRTLSATPTSLGLRIYTQRLSRDKVVPGTWADAIFAAAERGELSAAEARSMVIDFVVPSLDTTVLASGHLLWLLGRNPEAWERSARTRP